MGSFGGDGGKLSLPCLSRCLSNRTSGRTKGSKMKKMLYTIVVVDGSAQNCFNTDCKVIVSYFEMGELQPLNLIVLNGYEKSNNQT